jgi:hypothetical protein
MKRALTITAGAAAIGAVIWLMPARPHLTHMDFIAGGPNALEFCSADNPRFLPVVARDSPVAVSFSGTGPYLAGQEAELALVLRTNTGKAVGPRDLLVTGGRKLNLFAIDPSLTDFQALDAQPGKPGEWRVRFTPRFGGAYRFFADFTPVATGQEMYASADLAVQGGAAPAGAPRPALSAAVGGLRFRLSCSSSPLAIREPAILTLGIARADGTAVAADRTGGGGPELVAFDRSRSGMVDLRLDSGGSSRVSFADSGRYALWALVHVGGQERLAPFSIGVQP